MNPPEANFQRLLLRAHDLMCSARANPEDHPDCSDLIDDIRCALDLPVTDCDTCHKCIAKADAVSSNSRTFCPECAEIEADLSIPPSLQ